tara:strand:- start:312 stop:593 length:282 start_codon:yes stop_codon:yes gene_type:complete
MIVGTCQVKLFLHENNSLKGKRKVVKSIKDRVRIKFNVSIAEVDNHDNWKKIVLGIVTVSNDKKFIHKVLENVITSIDSMHLAEILDYKIEML